MENIMTISRGIAAILISAGVAVGSAAPASAAPCNQWGFDGRTGFMQDNGWVMWFDSQGARAQGAANAYSADLTGSMHGTIDGRIDGYAINLTARWDGGALGKYEGSVDANGFASGVTYDAKTPTSHATWRSDRPLRCVTPVSTELPRQRP